MCLFVCACVLVYAQVCLFGWYRCVFACLFCIFLLCVGLTDWLIGWFVGCLSGWLHVCCCCLFV